MRAKELISDPTTFLVLYRVAEKGGIGTADERRDLLTDTLAEMNGNENGRFFEEAGHVSTSAWTVTVPSSTSANDLVQELKRKAKFSAGVDYLWAIQIADPVNESHITKEPKPQQFPNIALKS